MKILYQEFANNSSEKIIDKKEAINRLGGNEKLYLQVIKDFYNRYKTMKFDILDTTSLQDYIHNLSGLSGTIGANTLKNLAHKALENLDKEDITKVEDELDRVLINIEKLYFK